MPVFDYIFGQGIRGKEMVMELYLFLAMFLIYVLTAFMVKPHVLNRIWSLAFVVCFAVTAVAIAFIRISDFSYFLFIARRRRRYGEKFPA